jgi:aldehyde:ferredoxin oxidoreductase
VKLHDRSRSDDETIIPYFEQPERFVNPFVGRPMALEAEKFGAVLDEFYTIRGWSRESGTPTGETLQRLGL